MLLIVPAGLNDAKVLFDWRNDPLTREMSKHSAPIDWDSHVAWLTARLARSEPHLYIASFKDRPVGTFRVDGDEISYTISPDERGKGYGLLMLCRAREMFGALRAEIYSRNAASIKVAERSGMLVKILAD